MLVNRRKKSKALKQNEVQERIAKSIVHRIIFWQTKWAEWMQVKTECLSVKGKIMGLLLFCFIACAYSIYLAATSSSGKQVLPVTLNSIKQPNYIQQSGENTRAAAIVNQEEYKKIKRFRQYMDSLAPSPSGKILHDNILIQHPGILDSIMLLENMYQLETKK